MTDKLERALAKEFLFMQAAPDTAFWYGVECGDGWYPLLREMCGEIVSAYERAGGPVDIVVEQVKEKYGQLHVYFCAKDSVIEALIRDIVERYEDKSARVCEVCSGAGRLRADLGYIRTLCEKHYETAK